MLDQKTTTSLPAATESTKLKPRVPACSVRITLMSFSVPWTLLCEAESQQESPWSSLAVASPTWSGAQKGQLSPRSHNSDLLYITPEGELVFEHWDSKINSVKEQIIVTHIVCMQHSEELRIGDELHSWRLQQQGDFLRIHRRKGTFPPNL